MAVRPMNWRYRLHAASVRLVTASEGISALLLIFVVACDGAEIFCRYVLVAPLSWTDEAMRYAMAWLAFLSGSALVFRGEHMAAGLLTSPRLGRVRRWVQSAVLVAIAAFAFELVWYGLPLSLRNATQISPSAGIPMIWPTLSVVFGGVLSLFYIAVLLLAPEDAAIDDASETHRA
ncbi:MAG: TRAP transporter small permease [Alphaproteobacteria bacterium]|nr:TRAP transporter small permease [Alphaproteobacteria bacterium]